MLCTTAQRTILIVRYVQEEFYKTHWFMNQSAIQYVLAFTNTDHKACAI